MADDPWAEFRIQPKAAVPQNDPWAEFRIKPAAEPRQASPDSPRISPTNAGVSAGMTANLADELFAAGMTPIEMGMAAYSGEDKGKGLWDRVTQGYDRALAKNRQLEANARAENPIATTVGDVAGGLMTANALAKGGLTMLGNAAPTVRSMALRGGAEGALYGAAYGAGAGEGGLDRLKEAAKGAAVGGALGGVVGAGSGALASRAARNAVASNDDLRTAASQAYQRADDAGVIFTPEGMQRLNQDVQTTLADFGYHPQLQPRVGVVLGELERLGTGNVTLKGVDQLRRIANAARMSADPSEQTLGRKLIDHIDDFVVSARPGEVLAGDQAAGSAAIREGRQLWGAVRKSEMLDDALGKADLRAASTGSGGNLDNATRQNVRRLLDNPRTRAGFTPDEVAALESVVRGTPTQNSLRLLGKLSPSGNGLMAAMNAGAAGATGGLSLPVTGAAAAAKFAADRMTGASADFASSVIRNLGKVPELASLTPLQRQLIENAIRAGAIEGPRATGIADR